MPNTYSEDSLVERPAIAVFGELSWETANCFYESFQDSPSPVSSPSGRGINLGRETSYDVILERRLRPALRKLNPDLPEEALSLAVEEIRRSPGG